MASISETQFDYSVEQHGQALSWSGLLYCPGEVAGPASASSLLRNFDPMRMRGHFFACHSSARTKRYFVDNSGIFPAFHNGASVAASYLDLCAGEIDEDAVLDLLLYGHVTGDKTPTRGVRRLRGDEILLIEDGSAKLVPKELPSLFDPPSSSFDDEIGHLCKALEESVIEIDLTGGLDSRLIAAALHAHGVPFRSGLAASWDHEDARISARVADAIGIEHHRTEPEYEVDLDALRKAAGGMIADVEVISRKQALQLERKSRGATIALSGVGGEMFKDFWWLQDFPFYRRSRPNLAKLYNTRIEPVRFPNRLLSHDSAARADQIRLTAKSAAWNGFNTQVYDQIYFSRMRSIVGPTRAALKHLTGLDAHAPLLEWNMVHIGFHLPRRKRAFDAFHREMISHYSRAAAEIPTTRGMPATAGTLRHGLRYSWDIGSRAMNKLAQRARKKRTDLQAPGNRLEFMATIRQSEAFTEALDALKVGRVVANNVDPEDVPLHLVDRIYAAGTVVRVVNSEG